MRLSVDCSITGGLRRPGRQCGDEFIDGDDIGCEGNEDEDERDPPRARHAGLL